MAVGPIQMDSVLRILECPICFELLNDPKELECRHTFCKTPCLEQLVDAQTRIIECPLCRTKQKLSPDGVSGLLSNRTMLDLIDLTKPEIKLMTIPKSTCDVCCLKLETTLCRHCNKYVCPECKERHTKHMLLDVQKLATNLSGDAEKSLAESEVIKNSLENTKQILSKTKTQTIASFDKLIEDVKQRGKQLEDQLDEYLTKELSKVEDVRRHRENLTNVLDHCRQASEITTDDTSQKILLTLGRNIQQSYQCVQADFVMPQFFDISVKVDKENVTDLVQSLGKITILPRVMSKVTPKSESGNERKKQISAFMELRKLVKGTPTGVFLGIHSVAISPKNGDIAVSDSERHVIAIYSTNCKFISELGGFGNKPGHFNTPRGITYNSKNQLIIADSMNHRIQMFNDKQEFLKCFSSKGLQGSHVNEPYDVAANDKHIYVCDYGNDRIRQFTKSGANGPGTAICQSKFTKPRRIIHDALNGEINIIDDEGLKVFEPNQTSLYKDEITKQVSKDSAIARSEKGDLLFADSSNKIFLHSYEKKLTESFCPLEATTSKTKIKALAARGSCIVVAGKKYVEIYNHVI